VIRQEFPVGEGRIYGMEVEILLDKRREKREKDVM
jgi:hypothetical protein